MKFLSLISIAVVLVCVQAGSMEDKAKAREWFCKKASESSFAVKTFDCVNKNFSDESKAAWGVCRTSIETEPMEDSAFLMKMCMDQNMSDMAMNCWMQSGKFPPVESLRTFGECVMHLG